MYRHLWTKDFIFITLINFLMYIIHYALIVTVTSFTIDTFHAGEGMGGLAAGIFIIGMLFGRLFTGKYIDQLNLKKTLLASLVFSFVAIALYFLIHSLLVLIIVRLIHGIAFGMASTTTGTYSSTIVPEDRKGEGIGYYALSTTVASAIGPFLGILINQRFSFESNFIVCLICILLAGVLSLFISNIRQPMVDAENKEVNSAKGIGQFLQKQAIPISIVIVFVGIAYSSVLAFLDSYASHIGLAAAASFFFVVYAFSTFVVRPITGKVFDNYGANKVVYPVLVLFVIGLVLLSVTHSSWMLLFSAIFIGIGYGTLIPSFQTIAIQASPPEKIGLATSTFYIFADLGAGAGPTLLGILIGSVGYRNLYMLMALLLVGVIALYYFMHGRKHKTIEY
ncbi:multidrug MFS transporter [Staphylococcus simulans]|uniref:MFS transporter n=1 Tax=Staphylococcus simulans TaxID=1286 RepID=UPI000D0A780B|nr:MFS transporter [Staphylococcus simulans]AVO03124.1 multidrug MFS transporter [Staphylococcus simulans]AVO06079.1 multidrug MFS transporter [Staphylococcus simulans]AWG19672.1 multidrug MFS transporter [Staphylococcus simulans]AWI02621.1 multidrug MFS transporter [Staphylococcus simulans]UXR35264.1 MFS transporter [Staphylococcus simulans]